MDEPESGAGAEHLASRTLRRRVAVVLLAMASGLASLVALELAFRWVGGGFGVRPAEVNSLQQVLALGDRLIRPHPYTNYVAHHPGQREPTHPRDWAFDLDLDDGIPRIACLGGSTTYGDYPQRLSEALERRTGAPVHVMNWGVPGWTSLDSLVNWFATVQDYEPHVVVVHHGANDTFPRMAPGYRTDLSHWRTPWREPDVGRLERRLLRWSDLYASYWLSRRGEVGLHDFVIQPDLGPAPEGALGDGSERGFRRNLEAVSADVHRRGGQVVLMTQPFSVARAHEADPGELATWEALLIQHNQLTREVAQAGGSLLVDLPPRFVDGQDELFMDRIHLKERGRQLKADVLADAIVAAGLLDR
jgi:lysophospholipase L1-like esterase